jgi:hypothetical protein
MPQHLHQLSANRNDSLLFRLLPLIPEDPHVALFYPHFLNLMLPELECV